MSSPKDPATVIDLDQQIRQFDDQGLSISKVTGNHRRQERIPVQPFKGKRMLEGRSD